MIDPWPLCLAILLLVLGEGYSEGLACTLKALTPPPCISTLLGEPLPPAACALYGQSLKERPLVFWNGEFLADLRNFDMHIVQAHLL